MNNKRYKSGIINSFLAIKLSLIAFIFSLVALSQNIDKGGALGNASSALTTIDRVYYKNLKASWVTKIKIARSFDNFILNVQAPSEGKLYLISAPTDLGFSNASQIKSFVGVGSTIIGVKTLEMIKSKPTNESMLITIDKDNNNSNLKTVKDSLGLDFHLYIAYEKTNGTLENEVIHEPISLLQEFQSFELSHAIKPPYAYTIGFPLEYFQNKNNKKFPVIINLHGAGGGKEGAAGMAGFKSPRRNGYSCIVISPASGGGRWEADKLKVLMDHIKSEYSAVVDANRIYFMGFSMGGRGVWDMAMKYGDKIAAAVPNAGGFRGETDVSDMDFSKVIDLPFWAFHNCDDNVADISIGWAPINALVAAGGKPKFLINIAPNPKFPSEDKNNKNENIFAADYRNLKGSRKGHKLNGNYFYTEEFYKWLFSQTR